MKNSIEYLKWDSEWLGVPVGRVAVVPACSEAKMRALVGECRASGIRLLYLVCESAPLASAVAAVGGAWLADVKLTCQLLLSGPVLPMAVSPDTSLELATAVNRPLEVLAWQSGEQSRFRRDPKIGVTAFESLYSRWLEQAVEQGNEWVAAVDGKPCGLLAVGERENHASIELLAVSPALRRRRIGHLLLQKVAKEACHKGHSVLQVVTQGANQECRQFYERCGFDVVRTQYIYHVSL